MTANHRLSSEQALEDYFTDLLEEDFEASSVEAHDAEMHFSQQFEMPANAYMTQNWLVPNVQPDASKAEVAATPPVGHAEPLDMLEQTADRDRELTLPTTLGLGVSDPEALLEETDSIQSDWQPEPEAGTGVEISLETALPDDLLGSVDEAMLDESVLHETALHETVLDEPVLEEKNHLDEALSSPSATEEGIDSAAVEPFSDEDFSMVEGEDDEYDLYYQPQPQLASAPEEPEPELDELNFDLSEVERLLGQLESVQSDVELQVQPIEREERVEISSEPFVDDSESEEDLEAQFAEVARLEALEEARAFSQQLDVIHEELASDSIETVYMADEVLADVADNSKSESVAAESTFTDPAIAFDAINKQTGDDALHAPIASEIPAAVEPVIETTTEAAHQPETQNDAPPAKWENTQPDTDFQVLFFEVCDVTFAVPLAELGGIHRLGHLNNLPGKPAWYLGLHTTRNQQFDVVDTAYWAMPDMLSNDEYKEDYSYIVMLGASRWGLACDTLQGTQTLTRNNIRWREEAGKRPWLAGMVKEKMCALIHVEALIAMLNAGLDVKAMA